MNKAYANISETILNYIKTNNELPWQKPWHGSQFAISHCTGKRYSFLNQFLLNFEATEFVTWSQVQALKAHIKKGCHGRKVYFWKTFEKAELDKEGNRIIKQIPFLKSYIVFRVDDCEGIERKWTPKNTSGNTNKPIDDAEKLIKQYLDREQIKLDHSNTNESFYSARYDRINVPPLSHFKSSVDYYNCLLHECAHSSGHPKRLNRLKPAFFGSEPYSREELIAEMASSFLMHQIGIDNIESTKQNAAYIKNWIQVLANDYSLIPIAASKAERAVEFILGTKEQ